MNQRFGYVKYDEETTAKQETLKAAFEKVEGLVDKTLPEGRAKSLVMTKMEEAYMWTGKALRDEQIEKDGQIKHQPARTNG